MNENAVLSPKLMSSEDANLWNMFMVESLLIAFKKPLYAACEDAEIRTVIATALEMSERYVRQIAELYRSRSHPVPKGFSEEDTNPRAPRLFSDDFALRYINDMAKLGLRVVPQSIGEAKHRDVLDFLYRSYDDYKQLYDMCAKLLEKKGLFPSAPSVPTPDKEEFVESDRYFAGWLGKQRSLNVSEIRAIHFTIEQNAVSKTLLTGFSRVTQDPEIRDHFRKGVKMADEIIRDLERTLREEHVNLTSTLDNEVLPAVVSPYSDKLMLAHVAQMGSGAIAIYGTYLSLVHRRDLGVKFLDMIKEGLKYASDGVDLMVQRGWLEQPPTYRDAADAAQRDGGSRI